MSLRDFGEFVYGDEVTALPLHFTDASGNDYNLTGASAITLVGRTLEGENVTLSGTVQGSATLGDVDFAAPGTAVNPGARSRAQVLFRVKWTVGGDLKWTPALGTFTVVRWP